MKLFLVEQGSDAMLRFAEAEDGRNKIVSALVQVEASSAMSRLTRELRMDAQALKSVQGLIAEELGRVVVQPLTAAVLDTAAVLTHQYSIRTLDAIQLGSAVIVRNLRSTRDMRFIASDLDLLNAARQEGFATWNPCD